jgi:hypothetical protein
MRAACGTHGDGFGLVGLVVAEQQEDGAGGARRGREGFVAGLPGAFLQGRSRCQ